jgi:hypothetical protein
VIFAIPSKNSNRISSYFFNIFHFIAAAIIID